MKRSYFFAAFVFLICAAIIFPYVRWYADNPDTFQYLEISKKYIAGNIQGAINGYWSPMISWLLIIPLLLMKDEIIAFKILQLVIGLFTLYQWNLLTKKTCLNDFTQKLLLFVSIPFLLSYSLLNCTPDLLFMGLLFTLMNIFTLGETFTKEKVFKTGITGALLFFTKSFGLPLFAVTLMIVFFIEKKVFRKNPEWRNFLSVYATFFVISIVWITALSSHYHSITISKSATFNMSADAAPLSERGDELPVLGTGLLNPKNGNLSAWETPGDYVSQNTISILSNPEKYAQVIKRNILSVYYFDFRNQAGIILILLVILLAFAGKIKKVLFPKWVLVFILFILMIYAGYSLILVHQRYIWINTFLITTLIIYFIDELMTGKKLLYTRKIFVAMVILLVIKRPVKEILFSADRQMPVHWLYTAVMHPLETMRITYRTDNELQKAIDEVEKKKLISGNIASLKSLGDDRSLYTSSMRVAQRNNCMYFGQLDETLLTQQQRDTLIFHDVRYLITWKNMEWGSQLPLYYNTDSGMRIYNVAGTIK